MSTTLAVNPIRASVGWDVENTNTFGTNSVNVASFSYSSSLINGTGAGASSKMYAATLTVAASATTSLNLFSGLSDPVGNALVFAKVKQIYVQLTTATTSSAIQLAGNFFVKATADTTGVFVGATTGTPYLRIRNGGVFMLGCTDATGYTVTNTTQNLFTITNEDGSNVATVNLFICGE